MAFISYGCPCCHIAWVQEESLRWSKYKMCFISSNPKFLYSSWHLVLNGIMGYCSASSFRMGWVRTNHKAKFKQTNQTLYFVWCVNHYRISKYIYSLFDWTLCRLFASLFIMVLFLKCFISLLFLFDFLFFFCDIT